MATPIPSPQGAFERCLSPQERKLIALGESELIQKTRRLGAWRKGALIANGALISSGLALLLMASGAAPRLPFDQTGLLLASFGALLSSAPLMAVLCFLDLQREPLKLLIELGDGAQS